MTADRCRTHLLGATVSVAALERTRQLRGEAGPAPHNMLRRCLEFSSYRGISWSSWRVRGSRDGCAFAQIGAVKPNSLSPAWLRANPPLHHRACCSAGRRSRMCHPSTDAPPRIDTTAEPDFVAYIFGDDMIAIAAGVVIAGMAALRPIPATRQRRRSRGVS
jgi:hypothetical protein